MCLYVLVCLCRFYMFVLIEIDERFLNCIRVYLIWKQLGTTPQGPTRVSLRRTKLVSKRCQNQSQPTRGNQRILGPSLPSRLRIRFTFILGRLISHLVSIWAKPRINMMVCKWLYEVSTGNVDWHLQVFCKCLSQGRVFWEIQLML